ncbi:2-octaprenyl-6-methoxyphenyl hydroxylase [Halioglobus maricola]|uniref:2-octaprenyl-6-methoxyphenyl hydroxylase n=2 Tax=Halioglobus maricola TaxID=2601894 RepID=A0A5P9NRG1_9GAMM|nr:2-octaprenyl-6-methoxyphenyl hydroxylase [Halioglobus maricola]
MVGISLAMHLAHSLPADVSICLIEGFPFPQPEPGHRPAYHPAFDARSTALSYSSRLIYEQIGLWPSLAQYLCPIETIHVSSRGRFGSTLMDTASHSWEALGYVVENAWLGNALIQALYQQGRVEVRSPCKVLAAKTGTDGVRLELAGEQGGELSASLLVVADGAASGLRESLGVAVSEKPYRQQALIANIATAQPHEGRAYERFTSLGPLAMLPLPAVSEARHRSALVWTVSPEEGAELMASSDEEFLSRLQARFGYRLGRLTRVGERHSYPLSLVHCPEQVRQGVVVMGNAAHALHPVAGQGYNLALRDVAELARVLAGAVEEGEGLGDLNVLQRYERLQQADQQRTIEFSDRLPALFMQADPLLGLARDLALSGLDFLPALKREFVNQAAGVAALGE